MVYRKPNTEQKASQWRLVARNPSEDLEKLFKSLKRIPFSNLNELSSSDSTITDDSNKVSLHVLFGDAQVPQESMDDDTSLNTMKEQKLERIIIPFAVDSAQQEALFALKNLQFDDEGETYGSLTVVLCSGVNGGVTPGETRVIGFQNGLARAPAPRELHMAWRGLAAEMVVS
ncbi:hypothetical protein CASFOL_021153 [Castilleja foliolosa]|uniref:Uncharacterized protein n=1 Tax=Castilleja foliolosa TaxID=1961234 RepID=A0ABD3CYD5_9LAMI